MKEYSKNAQLGLRALKRAAAKVAKDAREKNYKIPIWRDGEIVYEIPELIPEEPQETNPQKPS
jgi:hypothetical protein